MSQNADSGEPVTVATDGVTVTKRFKPEAFAVPTIEFTIESERDETVTIRLVDRIPEAFPMDGVGFHPEYGSDNWTAYKNHRVEFEAELDPEEEIVTVYGIRITEPGEAVPFLTEPSLEVEAADAETAAPDEKRETAGEEALAGTAVSDLVDEEGTGVVRDFITGERDTLPGLETEGRGGASTADTADEAAAEADSEDPGVGDLDIDEAELEGLLEEDGTAEEDERIPDIELESEAESSPAESASDGVESAETSADPQAAPDEGTETSEQAAIPSTDEAAEASTSDTTPEADPSIESIAEALANELEAGTVPDGVVETIRSAVHTGPERRFETQLDHLHARVGELEAYADAFGDFLDEHGTGDELVDEMTDDIATIEDGLEDLRDRTGTLEEDLGDVDGTVARHGEDLEDLSDSVDALDNRLEALTSDQQELAQQLEDDVDRLEDRVEMTAEDIEETLTSLRSDVEEIDDTVEAIEEWRSQLGEMFSD